MSNRAKFISGIRAQAPILVGILPFGMIYGISAVEAGLPPSVALGMSMIVFAGSSQFIAVQLFAAGTPGIIIILTTLIVNLRHMLYSASVAPYVHHLSLPWKLALPWGLTDEVYAVAITHYRQHDLKTIDQTNEHWFFLGAGFTLWSSWVTSSLIGIFVGASVPAGWSLDFALALTFIALIVPALEDSPTVVSALVAGITAVLAHDLRLNLGLIVAVLAGIAAGVAAERYQSGVRLKTAA